MGEETAVAPPEPAALGAAAVALLGELVATDTVNPPGNEARIQGMLAERLAAAGFECELLSAEEGRPNLVATLAGGAEGETLCLLGHVDTVPADREEWSFDPWAGDVVDGFVRGRGTQDMKGQVAAEVAAALGLAGSGWRPARGSLKLVLTADEEAGAHAGAKWLCDEHPEKVRADLVINEGGGHSFELDGRRFYTLCVGEKGVHRFRLRARGTAGHASVPALGDNALLRLAPALERFREQPRLEPSEDGIAFVSAVLEEEVAADTIALEAGVERLRGLSPQLASFIAEPMLRVTMAPTMIDASAKDNVIPSAASVLIDCRVPPGLGEDEVRDRLAELLGPLAGEFEVEFTEQTVGNRSPAASPLADAIGGWLGSADRGATLVPIVMAGFSDSHWFRKAFPEATVYGFCPQREHDLFEAAQLVHGADERVAVSDVELAAGFYADIARTVLG